MGHGDEGHSRRVGLHKTEQGRVGGEAWRYAFADAVVVGQDIVARHDGHAEAADRPLVVQTEQIRRVATTVDRESSRRGEADGLQLTIWDRSTGKVVYDTRAAAPPEIGGGSIEIKK